MNHADFIGLMIVAGGLLEVLGIVLWLGRRPYGDWLMLLGAMQIILAAHL